MPEFFGRPRQSRLGEILAQMEANKYGAIGRGIESASQSIGSVLQNLGMQKREQAQQQTNLTQTLAQHGLLGQGGLTGTVRDGQKVWDQGVPLTEAFPAAGFKKDTGMFLRTAPQAKPATGGLSASEISLIAEKTGLKPEQLKDVRPEIASRLLDAQIKREAVAAKPEGTTKAQDAVDRKFGTEYATYVAGGGYADTMTQISSLDSVLADLKTGKKNLTGPGIGLLPEIVRKRTHAASVAAQQTVEGSVQRSLKQTLGGQYTEKEGVSFMQRGYDPSLPEAENAKKLERMMGQLKTMAQSKQDAIDYFEKNGTLKGYKGTFYTISNGDVVKASVADFAQQQGGKTGDTTGAAIEKMAKGPGDKEAIPYISTDGGKTWRRKK